MRMRTMHSILHALSQFDAEAIVVSPPEMALKPEFKAELDEMSVAYREAEAVPDVIGEADIIYMEPVVQADYTQSRVERGTRSGARRPSTRSPPSCCARRRSAARSSCTRCRAWTS
jgi:aspartate carbamoyltransferase catalytic subunit